MKSNQSKRIHKVKIKKLIKSCENCIYDPNNPPPHTCDFCDSLDTSDYYMWEYNGTILDKKEG